MTKDEIEKLYIGGRIDIPLMTAYGKGNRSVITPAIFHYDVNNMEIANMQDFFKTTDQDRTPPGIDRMWRDQGMHLKSHRAQVYSECCRHWLNEPLDDLSKVMENRGWLLIELCLRSQIAEVRYAAMQLYLFMATVLDPPFVEGEE